MASMELNTSNISDFFRSLPVCSYSRQIQLPSTTSFFVPESRIFQAALSFSVLLCATFISVYIVTWLSFVSQRRSQEPVKVPPTVPYMIPFIGAAISLALGPAKFFSATSRKVGPQAVHGLMLLNTTLYFVYKPENVAKLWNYKKMTSTPGVTAFVLRTLLGLSPKALSMYALDTSGVMVAPKPGSDVAPHNRIDHLTHASFHKHLLGPGLNGLYRSFLAALLVRFPSLNIKDEWTEFPDIMEFWLPPLTATMNETLAGPILECVNPNFTQDLLSYFPYSHQMMVGTPRWCIPKVYRLREKLIQDVKQWHAIARKRFHETDINEDGGADPWWGSAFMRERQNILKKVDNWDYDAIASSDFGVLWGASVNIHPMAIWSIIEVFRDKDLLFKVRAELAAAEFQGITSSQDIDKLLSLPLLQSVYAETLRLRIEVQTIFSGHQEDIVINEWRFPPKSLVIVPSGAAHRDSNFWNTKDGQHPLDTFWADRFLAYRNDPQSGPRRYTVADGGKSSQETPKADSAINGDQPKFVSSGLANSYIPFGLGERMCPGRAFARREIVAFCAIIVHQFDVELLSPKKDFELNPVFYGLGTQRPLGSIPFKIRNRKLE